jgi:hypothetical protein
MAEAQVPGKEAYISLNHSSSVQIFETCQACYFATYWFLVLVATAKADLLRLAKFHYGKFFEL